MENIIKITVAQEFNEYRLDKFLAENLKEQTRSYIQKLIANGCVHLKAKPILDKKYKVKTEQEIEIEIPITSELSTLPEEIPLEIIYEDQDLIIVNKQKGMVVHPAPGNFNGTLVNALLFYAKNELSGINGIARPGIVHRIDKDTSGLLIVAKNDLAHKNLAEQIKLHSFKREYQAVVHGVLPEECGTINKNIGRHKIDRKKMAVTDKNSKTAITHFQVLQRFNKFTHIKLNLETGRTHQIRVHMASIGHPVAGDTVYGPKKEIKFLNGQCLHAKKIGFVHPRTLKYMEFDSELPEYFKKFLRTFLQFD